MVRQSQYGLENHGLENLGRVFWTCSAGTLYEEAVKRGEAVISEHGALIAHTGAHTGRSANDKFIVEENSTKDQIWWGKINQPISEEKFDQLHRKMCEYFNQKDVFVQWRAPHEKYEIKGEVNTVAGLKLHWDRKMKLIAEVPKFEITVGCSTNTVKNMQLKGIKMKVELLPPWLYAKLRTHP